MYFTGFLFLFYKRSCQGLMNNSVKRSLAVLESTTQAGLAASKCLQISHVLAPVLPGPWCTPAHPSRALGTWELGGWYQWEWRQWQQRTRSRRPLPLPAVTLHYCSPSQVYSSVLTCFISVTFLFGKDCIENQTFVISHVFQNNIYETNSTTENAEAGSISHFLSFTWQWVRNNCG